MESGINNAGNLIPTKGSYFPWLQRFTLAVSIFFLFLSGLSFASTLTVGNGKEYSSIRSAVNAASCGDTIDIYAGIYKEHFKISKSGCTSSNYLTVRAAEDGVILDIQNSHEFCLTSDGISNYAGICAMDTDYLHIGGNGHKIEIRNIGVPNPAYFYFGVYVRSGKYNNIQDIEVTSGTGGNGIRVEYDASIVGGINTTYAPHATVKNNSVVPKPNQIDVCYENLGSDNHLFASNVCKNPMKTPVYFVHSDHFIFEKNYVYFRVPIDNEPAFGPIFREFEDGIIRYNVIDVGVLTDSSVTGSIMFYDATDNDVEGCKVYNNILLGDSNTKAAIYTSRAITNIEVMNNIITNPNYAYYQLYEGTSTITSKYNIFTMSSGEYENGGNLNVSSSNNYFHSVTYYSSENKPFPYFMPLSESAYQVDKGTYVGYAGTDYQGNKVPNGNGIDIGAFEYISNEFIANVPPNPPLLISID